MIARRPCWLPSLALALSATPLAQASGGDGFTDNPYMPLYRVPVPELEGFAAGRLGVLQGAHWRIYQVLAWRALHGLPLPAAEFKALNLRGWLVGPEGMGYDHGYDPAKNGVAAWLAARDTVAPPLPEKARPGVEVTTASYSTYINCPVPAFERAAQTLRDRLRQYGAPAAQAWVAGQDAVFANCAPRPPQGAAPPAAAPILPPAVPPSAPAWLAADRAYQEAAALFYAGQHAKARQAFLAIAADPRSPWQPLGAYLATRSLIRQATLMPAAAGQNGLAAEARPLLETARRELLAQAPRDPAAAALVGWVDARLRPAERLAEAGRALQTGALAGAERVALLSDYLALMDKQEDRLAQSAEPLTAWIGQMQGAVDPYDAAARATGQARARERWRQDFDPAWLLPLAALAQRWADLSPDELQAARNVPAGWAGRQTLNWHLARLMLVSGQEAAADSAIDQALQDPSLSPTTRNRWLQLKLASAASLNAMLAAARRAVAEPGSATAVPVPDETRAVGTVSGIGDDFPQRIYRHLPLSTLAALAANPAFPAALQPSHAELVFTRALVLEDWATADKLAQAVAASRATTRHLYQRYLAAQTPQARRLAAALLIVNTPELSPAAVSARGPDRYWGCLATGESDRSGLLDVPVRALSEGEQAQARREMGVLEALPLRSRWIASTLMPWAAGKPDDPEAPKALHFLVASTRLECGAGERPNPGAPNPSKDAFQLLHKLWPASEWAAKTKYWY